MVGAEFGRPKLSPDGEAKKNRAGYLADTSPDGRQPFASEDARDSLCGRLGGGLLAI